jgi:glutamate-1-semialdehyde aminotransferase
VIVMADDGYHGFHDWCLADTSRGNGIPTNECEGFSTVMPLDLDGYMTTAEAKQYVAAVIIEPDQHPDWLAQIRQWCSAHGAVMIADEVNCWQRYPEWTGCAHFGVTPDLWCLGKSLGNGMPVSAIVGPASIMRRFAPGKLPNAFFSSTWAGHPLSIAAVIATLDVLEREGGCQKIWDSACNLNEWLAGEFDWFSFRGDLSGPPFNRVTNIDRPRVWRKLMIEHGVFIYGAHNLSLAHDMNAIHRLSEAWKNTVRLLPERLASAGESDESETTGVMRR